MLKKIIFAIFLNIALIVPTMAQYGNFSIKVRKVYPSSGVIYENSYNLLDELDKAKLAAINKYKGTSDNYLIELNTPNGKKTEELQNIRWIMTENGQKSNHKTKPSPKKSYNQPTFVTIYECRNDGSQKKQPTSLEYIYSYKLFVNNKEQSDYDNNYYTKEIGDKKADKTIKQRSDNNALYKIVRVNDNITVATNEDTYKRHVCDNMLEQFNDVQKKHDTILMQFYSNMESADVSCNDAKTAAETEIDKRYQDKLKMADTASYEKKIVLYEEAKVLKPEKAADLNNNINQVKKSIEDQAISSKEKKSWFRKLMFWKKDKDKKSDKNDKTKNKNKKEKKHKKNKKSESKNVKSDND